MLFQLLAPDTPSRIDLHSGPCRSNPECSRITAALDEHRKGSFKRGLPLIRSTDEARGIDQANG
jgi:hypothetical protein